jgi:DNA polymerase-3 subunit delta
LRVKTSADLARPPLGDVRLFLLFGPDQAGAAELARGLEVTLGGDRLELEARALEADPSRLAAEAAAVSMFGDRALIAVRGGGDGLTEAAQLLLDAPAAGNPSVVVAGELPRTSKLLKLVDAHPLARVLACYAPSDADLARLAQAQAGALGLELGPGVAGRLAELAGGERGVLAREIEKLADFADATPGRRARLDLAALAHVGAGEGSADLDPLLDAAILGQQADTARQLERLATEGVEGVTLLRAAMHRFALLAEVRAGMDGGLSAEAAVKAMRPPVFWKLERPLATAARNWPADRIARARVRLLETERAIRAPGSAGPRLAGWTLLALAGAAASQGRQRRDAAPTARR